MKKILNLISNVYFLIKNGGLPGSLVIVCREKQGEKLFLLIKSYHSNAITFPSGNLNLFENFLEAATRELFEETGLKTRKDNLFPTPLIHSFKYKNLPFQIKSQQKVFLLLFNAKTNYLNPQDKDIEWVRWYNLDKTLSLLTYPELKLTLKRAVKYLKSYEQRS